MKRGLPAAKWPIFVGFFLFGSPSLAAGTEPDAPGDLTITEFMAEPENGIPMYYGEWFEIYNGSGRNLDLDGLEIYGTSSLDSGFTIEEMTRGRLGTLSPSERK